MLWIEAALNKSGYSLRDFARARHVALKKLHDEKKEYFKIRLQEQYSYVINERKALLRQLKTMNWQSFLELLETNETFKQNLSIFKLDEFCSLKDIEKVKAAVQAAKKELVKNKNRIWEALQHSRVNPNWNTEKMIFENDQIELEVKLNKIEANYQTKLQQNEKQFEKLVNNVAYDTEQITQNYQNEYTKKVNYLETEWVHNLRQYNAAFMLKYAQTINQWSTKTTTRSSISDLTYKIDNSSSRIIIINAWNKTILQATCIFDPAQLLSLNHENATQIISNMTDKNLTNEFMKEATTIANWILSETRSIIKHPKK